uniref:Phosphatidylinositol transfer protein N-terminal domain-containing protein n=1 Tax=Aquila chrysaetos chrysaetos TaxID=223781 RepID=A0A663F6A6_AQUCH
MLIKEYHILLPMSLEEYQVAQLYMIQKKSREESSGEGSGVEILANRPYSDGPGGSGQYTHKIYHVGSPHPQLVEEESWNAYPYTQLGARGGIPPSPVGLAPAAAACLSWRCRSGRFRHWSAERDALPLKMEA